MRRTTCLLIALIWFVQIAVAQQGMTPQYESYVTYVADAVHGIFYQTVVLDGTTTGGCTQTITYVCGPNGQTCTTQYTYPSCLTATHLPKIYNVVGGVGGWSTGANQSPFSYISYQTTSQTSWVPGQQLQSSFKGEVICTAIGTIFASALQSGSVPPACNAPSSETSEMLGWTGITKGSFRMTLSSSQNNYDGHWVTESSPQPGTNECFIPNTGMPQNPLVEGSTWTVGNGTAIGHNQYGLDSIGFVADSVSLIRDVGPEQGVDLPCTVTFHQQMKYECSAILWWVFAENTLTQTVSNSGTTVCRASACGTTPF